MSEMLDVEIRGLRYRVHRWGAEDGTPVVCLHGWMDTGASFAAFAEALGGGFRCLAPDWRGFGDSGRSPDGCYWFPQYLADLDALLERLLPDDRPALVGHSLGGNVACLYGGIRPERVGPIVSVEGFGLPPTSPEQAPDRYAQWLDGLAEAPSLRSFPDFDALARHLMERDPWLSTAQAARIARAWGLGQEGRVVLRGDPAHKRPNPVLYRIEEAMACWRRVQAPVLWAYGEESAYLARMRGLPDWETRLSCFPSLKLEGIAEAGHAVHHDRPAELAERVREFLLQAMVWVQERDAGQ